MSYWRGAVIEVWESAIPNMRQQSFEYHICCLVTKMQMGVEVIYGYSNIVSNLESIFGNTIHNNEPIDLTLEFPTILDAYNFMHSCANHLMAAVSIRNGKTSHIYFDHYALEHVIVSQASVAIQPGTMGATAQITLVGYEYTYLESVMERPKYYRSTIELFDFHSGVISDKVTPQVMYQPQGGTGQGQQIRNEEDNSKCTIMFGDKEPVWAVYDVYILGLDIAYRDNIKMIGTNSEYTVYPRFPTIINLDLVIPRNPEAQSSSLNANEDGSRGAGYSEQKAEHNIGKMFETIKNMVRGEELMTVVSPMYGTIVILPSGITTDRGQDQQGSVGINGVIIRHTTALRSISPDDMDYELDFALPGHHEP